MAKLKKTKQTAGKAVLKTRRLTPGLGLAIAWLLIIASFLVLKAYERQIKAELAYRFCADGYILPVQASLPPETWTDLALDDAVLKADATQLRNISIEGQSTLLFGASLDSQIHRYRWLDAPKEPPLAGLSAIEPAYASQGFAKRFNVTKGQTLYLPTPRGPRKVVLAGIFAEYAQPQGSLVIDRSIFSHWFYETAVDYLAVSLKPKTDPAALYKRWQTSYPDIRVLSRRAFHKLLIHRAQILLYTAYTIQGIGASALVVLGLAGGIKRLKRR